VRGLALFLALVPGAAAALDCAAPPDAFQRAVCASPEARAAWQGMDQALAGALARAPDDEARAITQGTQDRWLAALGAWDVDATLAALEAEGLAEADPAATLARAGLIDLITAQAGTLDRLPATLAEIRALRAQVSGGPFATSTASCSFAEPEAMPSRRAAFVCGTTVSLQHLSRVCSVQDYVFGSGGNTVLSVDEVVAGALVHRGNCEGNGSPLCPEPGAAATPEAHWSPDLSANARASHADILAAAAAPDVGPLGRIDPATWPVLWPEDWFQTCLTTPDYPPPGQIRRTPAP
jgi:hypothetical protein